MQIEVVDKYIHVKREKTDGPFPANRYLGWRIAKASQPWDITLEDNIVNLILLGLDIVLPMPSVKNEAVIRQ